jgi:hypothetical protein
MFYCRTHIVQTWFCLFGGYADALAFSGSWSQRETAPCFVVTPYRLQTSPSCLSETFRRAPWGIRLNPPSVEVMNAWRYTSPTSIRLLDVVLIQTQKAFSYTVAFANALFTEINRFTSCVIMKIYLCFSWCSNLRKGTNNSWFWGSYSGVWRL